MVLRNLAVATLILYILCGLIDSSSSVVIYQEGIIPSLPPLRRTFPLRAVKQSSVAPIDETCTPYQQQEIRRCAQPLFELGAFRADGPIGFQFSWQQFVARTKEYFSEVCDAFFLFDMCIEKFKGQCFDEEPARSRYQTAIQILDFICRDGYGDMMRNFECFTRTLTRAEMVQCQTDMVADARRVPPQSMHLGEERMQQEAVCGALRNYVSCVKYPVRYECGWRTWRLVREMIVRPAVSLMPQCEINASASLSSFYSLCAVTLSLFVFSIRSSSFF